MQETFEKFKIKGIPLCFLLNLRMSGEDCSIFHCHSSRAVPGISLLEYQQRMTNTVQTGGTTLLQLLSVHDRVIDGNVKRQVKN